MKDFFDDHDFTLLMIVAFLFILIMIGATLSHDYKRAYLKACLQLEDPLPCILSAH